MLPRNPEEWDEVAAGFAKVSQDELFGGSVSAVDGSFQSTGQVFEALPFSSWAVSQAPSVLITEKYP